MRSLQIVEASEVALFTTAEAKLHLKVDSTDDDTLIDNLITAATDSAQIYTNRFFINTTVKQYGDTWRDISTLYKSPVSSVAAITYYDSSNALQTLDDAVYLADMIATPARISLDVDKTYPTLAARDNAVIVEYVVGYGSTAASLPEGIKSACLLMIANWYQNRQSVVTGTIANEMPLSSQYLLNQYKVQTC